MGEGKNSRKTGKVFVIRHCFQECWNHRKTEEVVVDIFVKSTSRILWIGTKLSNFRQIKIW